MSYFLKPNLNLFMQQKDPQQPAAVTKQTEPDRASQNWCDESTYLDNSTVPTYEEFLTKTKPKRKKKKSILKKKFSFLNSTEAASLLTDDESEASDDEENCLPAIDELTNTINNLDINPKKLSNLVFKPNYLMNMNNSPTISDSRTVLVNTRVSFKSKENLLIIKNTPEGNEYQTPIKNVIRKIPLETAPPKMVTSCIQQHSNSSVKIVTPTIYKSPSVCSSASKHNESADYVFYYNKLTQTSFVFSSSADESTRNTSSREPSIIVLNDSMDEEENVNDDIAKKLILNHSSSSEDSPPLTTDFLQRLNNITQRRSSKPSKKSVRKSILFNTGVPNKKRVSMCGDGMSLEQLRINETILDESENESDVKNGLIYSLYESANEDLNDQDFSDSDKSITNQQLTPKVTNENLLKFKVKDSRSSTDLTASSSDTPKRRVKSKNIPNMQQGTKLKSDDATTSSDGRFEKFLNQYKPHQNKEPSPAAVKKKNGLKNFIVNDDDSSEEDCEEENENSNILIKKLPKNQNKAFSPSSSSESTDETEDEQLFYIKTTKKLEEKVKVSENSRSKSSRKKFKTKISRSSLLNDSSSSRSESDSSSSFNSSSSSNGSKAWNTFRKNVPNNSNNMFKTPIATKKTENDLRLVKTQQITKKKPMKLSFVESLSTVLENEELRDPAVLEYMKKYKNKTIKNNLLRECYNKLNEGAFENKLPKDLKLTWSSRLTATGGYCKNNIKTQTSEIQLSTKVCDSPERMRDVLAHEMCHAATFLLNGILDGHGPIWKNWAARVNFSFKQIPKITVYHSYNIQKKFIYRCQKCLSEIHRFSKSIDINKQACGICHGRFDLIHANKQSEIKTTTFDDILNNNEAGVFTAKNDKIVPSTPKQPSAFSQFVKDNYRIVKQDKNFSKHQDIMKELGAQFKQLSTK